MTTQIPADRVPVYDRTGKIIATVHKAAQSVGAAKAAGAAACEWTLRFGVAGWMVKPDDTPPPSDKVALLDESGKRYEREWGKIRKTGL